jgi:type II secretory pathway component PulF
VLALDANKVPVLRAMARAMAKRGDLRGQGMLLVQALESSNDAAEQAALRTEIETLRQQLDD